MFHMKHFILSFRLIKNLRLFDESVKNRFDTQKCFT